MVRYMFTHETQSKCVSDVLYLIIMSVININI